MIAYCRTTLYLALLILLGMSSQAFGQDRQWGQNREIVQISEHVYRWGSDNQYGAYVLTDDGIVVIDGHYCQSNTVAWFKEELRRRHDVPVKFVVLSHDHQDHICHTQLFSDTAMTVGHRNIRPHIVREQRDAAVPDITFEESMDLHVGDVKIVLYYFGPSHSDNLIHVHVPQDEVLISIDIARSSLFPDLRDLDVHGAIEGYRQLARLEDVQIVVPGHGGLLTSAVFPRMRAFLQSLHDQVLDQMIAGKTLTEIRSLIAMDDFTDLGGLRNSLDTNIVTMYDYLYRYREPNRRIEPAEAVQCIVDSQNCRTAN